MTMQTQQQLDRTRQELFTAVGLASEAKDGLHTLLDAADTSARATTDADRMTAMTSAVVALAMIEVRKTFRLPAEIRAEVQAHMATDCPLAGAGKHGKLIGLLYKPWPWLFLAVAVFSPNFPALLSAITNAAK